MADNASATWGPVEEEWILRVPGRQHLAPQADLGTDDLRSVICPFCVDVPSGSGAAVHSVESKHPMVLPDDHSDSASYARHWVLVYGSSHGERLGDLSIDVTYEFIKTVAAITERLFRMSTVKAVFAFESVGDHFGPTVAHPHGQLVGLPFVPRLLSIASPTCALCAVPSEDLLVLEVTTANLMVSPWSRLPFEMLVAPKVHYSTLAELTNSELRDISRCIHTALNLAASTYNGRRPPYLINIMQAARDDRSHHLRIEVVPFHKDQQTLKRPGGMELGLGIYLNPMPAKRAAKLLRQVLSGGSH